MPQIAVICDYAGSYGRNVLRGIVRFAREVGDWEFTLPAMFTFLPIDHIGFAHADGLIAMVHNEELAQRIRSSGVPTVNVSAALADLDLPTVLPDDRQVGRVAYAYFRERGFRSLAFCGVPGVYWSAVRRDVFLEEAAKDDLTCVVLEAYPELPPEWFRTLPKPAAVFACNDRWGWHALDACRLAGVRVPEDVAILGVDDDELVVGLTSPPLSSIPTPGERIGYEAAALLSRILEGKTPPVAPIRLPVGTVITRQSSDVLAIGDPLVAGALKLLREAGAETPHVDELARALGVSRRSLERQFRAALGRSPAEEIRRSTIERAKQLLADTDLTIGKIADRLGFSSQSRFAAVFHAEVGHTPTAFRSHFRLGRQH